MLCCSVLSIASLQCTFFRHIIVLPAYLYGGQPYVLSLSLSAQIILPSSHACKTLNNKYDEVCAARRAAAAARTPRPKSAAAGGATGSGSVSELDSDDTINGSCVSSCRTDAPNADTDSVVGGPLHEVWNATGAGARQSAASGFDASTGTGVALPLHAYSDQVLLVQLEQLTLAAPAAPVLLQQMQMDLSSAASRSVPVTHEVPLWMQDPLLVQQLLDSSNGIVTGSSMPVSPAAEEQQASQQPGQQASKATATTAGAAVSASAAVQPPSREQGQSEIQPQPEQQQPASQQQPVLSAVASTTPAAPVAMRHGILLLPEDASLALTAKAPDPQLRHILSAAAIKQWFKRQVARVTPRRLVIRPGEAQRLAAAAAAGERAALAAARARAAAAGTAAAAAATLSSAQAAAAGLGPAGSGAVVPAAYCLLDFSKLELLAGRMERVQLPGFLPAAHSCSSSTGRMRPSATGHTSPAAPRASGGTLVGLTHMISKTHLRAAVHEFIRPAAVAAAAATGPGPAASTATSATAMPAAPTGCNVVALAASDGLALQLSGWSYQYLMAMVYGNLMYHQNSFEPYHLPGPSKVQHTTFNPHVKFGPAAGQLPYFALTLSSCSIQVSPLLQLCFKRWKEYLTPVLFKFPVSVSANHSCSIGGT